MGRRPGPDREHPGDGPDPQLRSRFLAGTPSTALRRTQGLPNTPFPIGLLGDRVYPTLEAKKEDLEPILRAWQAAPERVWQLCGWEWIRDALTHLPADTQVA